MENVKEKSVFYEKISNGYTLVDFWAEWCGPCKMLTPILEELEKDYKDIEFIKVNADLNPSILSEYKVTSIPHLIIFKDGVKIHEHIGAKPKVFMKAFIDEAIAL